MIGWLRAHLFRNLLDTLLTLIVASALIFLLISLYDWAIGSAVWQAGSRRECLDRSPNGACWAGVITWFDRFLYGRYPNSEIWRVNTALMLFLAWMAPLWLPRVRAKAGIGLGVVLLYPYWAVALFHGGERGLILQILLSISITGFAVTMLHTATCLLWGEGFRSAVVRLSGFDRRPDRTHRYPILLVLAALVLAAHAVSSGWNWPAVNTYKWGGLFLTLVVAGTAIATALPAGIVLAFGRRSKMPLIRVLCVAYIELVRSVPLVTVMFMATTMFPLFMPQGVEVNKLGLAIASICMFSAAYMAETVRGGIQAIPHHQLEAAQALGFTYWQSMNLVIMPQALRAMIPNIVGSFQGLFKDTAVISIFGFYDLMNMLLAVSQSPRWIMLFYEPICVAMIIYFTGCFAMSRYSRHLERKLGVGGRR